MPILRSARTCMMLVSLALMALALAPTLASAGGLTHEERVRRHEQRAAERELGTHEGARGACRLSAQASAPRVTVGEAVSVSGTLECPDAATAGERLVTVYRRNRGAARSVVATATPEADGAYTVTVEDLQANSIFYVRAGRAHAPRVAVRVTPRISLASPALASDAHRRRTAMTFTGTVGEAYAGAHVALQSSFAPADGGWKTIARGRVDAQGTFSMTHGFRLPGQRWVRAVVRVHGDAPAASEPIALDDAGAQNPALSIESSIPEVAYGQSVTISGTAALDDEPVTLLARTGGEPFQQVTTGMTDASGHYSFAVQPERRTWYVVRDAAAHSKTLMQDVSYAITPAGLPASIAAGEQVDFTGTLAPAQAGRRVELERADASGLGFHVIAEAPLEGTTYSLPYLFARPGSYTLRIAVDGSSGLASAGSAPFTVQVTSSASTALGASAPELLAG